MNAGSNDVWTYTIQPVTGALTLSARGKVRARQAPMGLAFASGSSPVTYTPKFAYATETSLPFSSSVEGFTVDASSGALRPIPASPFSTGLLPTSAAVDPSGRFAYVTSSHDDDVSGYTIDATTGALTPTTGSPFAAGRGPQSVAVDPSGRFVYVANFLDNSVSGYAIDSTSGALTPMPGSPFPASFPVSVAVDPTGRFAYVSNLAQGSVSGYTISPTTGALTRIPGSPFAGAPPCSGQCGVRPASSVAVDPTGKFAYVVNPGSYSGPGAVWGYDINATTGALTPIAGSPFATGAPATTVAVDPSGEFAYVATLAGLSEYTVDAVTGALTPIPGSPFGGLCSAGTYYGDACDSVAVDPSDEFAYVALRSPVPELPFDAVSGYSINDASGALTPIPASPSTASGVFTSIAVSGEIH